MNELNNNSNRIFFLAFFLFSFLFSSCFNPDSDRELNIFAAASLSGPLNAIKDDYKESINIDYDGSFSLINKINLGATPDIVIIAGLENVELINENFNKINSISPLIKNELVLINRDEFGNSLSLSEVCKNQKIIFGVADSLLAPLGKQSNLIMNKYEDCKKIMSEENIRVSSNAMALISALNYGHLDAAIIYKSDYVNSISNYNSFTLSEENFNEIIYYPVLVMSNKNDNKLSLKENFVKHLFSNEIKELFDRFGFEMVTNDIK
ncbi:MAG: substrate-binding domain-containing protein [Chloroflexota bacterium]|nr:substrate-binding domain-containing protein [Chloroflexota bacterium]|tara:strand:- start:3694 stop:4488 length:795 start_codon:yes stop_codon:yes gene_type:complete